MSNSISCFFAYPSNPPSLAETIEESIDRIRKSAVVALDGWKSTSVAGKFIMPTICEAIQQRDVFVCELTDLNHNVLFELGFAIAQKKRVWILVNTSIEKAIADYERFRLLTTVGYSAYRNSHEIEQNFYSQQPYRDLDSTIYKEAIESVLGGRSKPTLLYLKSGIETEASIKLTKKVHKVQIPVAVDDPAEVRIQTLSWYAQNVYSAHAVIVHFLSAEHKGWRLHNAKNSFVSGLAYGFGRHLLMLAHEPYESPIDYRDLLQVHRTAAQCEQLASLWLDFVEHDYGQHVVPAREYLQDIKAHTELQQLSIGDPIAENESDSLPEYFVPTAVFTEALTSKHSVVVGRKGTGKTAILYKLLNEIGSDVRNHVCVIKPVAYELEGILRMLTQALPISERGYLIESFWKFLIYTELAKSAYEELTDKPPHYERDRAEEELVGFVERNASIITPEFSIRLESAVARLKDLSGIDSAGAQRHRISELLHDAIIEKLRALLGRALEKKNKVAILVDNLDKAWNQREDLSVLSGLLLGLVSVSRRILRDFEKSDHWRRPVNLCMIIFVRSDIFSEVVRYARERDKISFSRIVWDDQELLLRVIEERCFLASALTRPEDVWPRFFCDRIKDIPTREYLITSVLPRPRDLVYLVKTALANAINRRHRRLEEDDIVDAERKYSQYALDSILIGNSVDVEVLEALLYEFAGSREIIGREEIGRAMSACKIPLEKMDEIVEVLFDLMFLGREVEANGFEFLHNEEDKPKYLVMARKIADTRSDKAERFRINKAFHGFLEVVPV